MQCNQLGLATPPCSPSELAVKTVRIGHEVGSAQWKLDGDLPVTARLLTWWGEEGHWVCASAALSRTGLEGKVQGRHGLACNFAHVPSLTIEYKDRTIHHSKL